MFTNLATEDLDLRELFNASPNAYVVFTRDLVIAGCNDAYLRAVGRNAREEIVGRLLFEAFPADPASDAYRILATSLTRVLETNQPDHIALIPYNTARPDEPPLVRYWSATHTPIRNKNGELAYILQHTVDVTELETLRQRDALSNMAESGVLSRAHAVQTTSAKLSTEIALLRDLFAQAPGFIAVLKGPDHVFELANDAYQILVGRRDLIGRSVAEALPEVVNQGFVDILNDVWKSGQPFVGRAVPVFLRPAGGGEPELRHIDFIYQPIRHGSGAVTGIFVQGHDTSAQWEAQRDLQRQTELLRLAQEGGGFGTYDWDLMSNTVRGTRVFRELFGLADAQDDIPVPDLMTRIHPEDAARTNAMTSGPSDEIETSHEFRLLLDGRVSWIGARGTIIRDVHNRPERVLGAVHDLTRRKQIEERLDMLARESAHRVKNILTIMQIIVDNTLRRAPSLESARESLGERIAALNKAQTRILAGPEECRLTDIVQDTLTVISNPSGRVTIEAKVDAELSPRTGLGVALALHELITNALKYGALSNAEGRVIIGWRVVTDGAADSAVVTLDWCEVGGPPIDGSKKGFGSILIRNSLAHDPRGRAEWMATPEGLCCQFAFSAKAIAFETKPSNAKSIIHGGMPSSLVPATSPKL